MRKIVVYSDCHWFGPTPVKVEPEFGPNVFYIGDNHEFKNIPYDEVYMRLNEYRQFLKKCKKTGTKVIQGNHEVSIGNRHVDKFFLNYHNAVMFHGHYPLWSEEKISRWHMMDSGKPRYKIFGIKIKNYFRNRGGCTKLSTKIIDEMFNQANFYEKSTVIFGHTHPKRLIDENHYGIRMINVPRGRTELEI